MMAYAKAVVELYDTYPGYGHPLEIEFEVSRIRPSGTQGSSEAGVLRVHPATGSTCLRQPDRRGNSRCVWTNVEAQQLQYIVKRVLHEGSQRYLDEKFAKEYLDKYTLREPVPSLPLYHLIGALDPLTEADVKERPNDRLPVTLGEWIKADSLTHLKIKLAGDQLDWDIERVLAIDKAAGEAQAARGLHVVVLFLRLQ